MATALIESDHEMDALAEVQREERLFELAQRKAKVYASSSLVPKEYQGNIGNVLIAENMARRMGADTLMVMQNLYVVHGRPAWSSQFLIATFNSCGRFTAIRYRLEGEAGKAGYGCVAYTTEIATGDLIEGTKITWEMANAEGWVNKSGSKWKTMPEQMMRYRAAAFLIRTTAPEIGMGLLTREETEDSIIEGTARPVNSAKDSLDKLTDKLTGDKPDEPSPQQEEDAGQATEPVETTPEQPPADPAALADLSADLAKCTDLTSVTLLEESYEKKTLSADQQTELAGRCEERREAIRSTRGSRK